MNRPYRVEIDEDGTDKVLAALDAERAAELAAEDYFLRNPPYDEGDSVVVWVRRTDLGEEAIQRSFTVTYSTIPHFSAEERPCQPRNRTTSP